MFVLLDPRSVSQVSPYFPRPHAILLATLPVQAAFAVDGGRTAEAQAILPGWLPGGKYQGMLLIKFPAGKWREGQQTRAHRAQDVSLARITFTVRGEYVFSFFNAFYSFRLSNKPHRSTVSPKGGF